MTVNVRRNEKSPVFEKEGQYTATISETLGENNRVGSVRARDDDNQVNTCIVNSKIMVSVQGTVDLWSYIMPIDRYSHTL